MKVELKDRTFGELVGQTYSLAAAHFGKLFVIVFAFSLPIWAVSYWMVVAQEHAQNAQQVATISAIGGLAVSLLSLILAPVEVGACTLLVASSFTDGNPSLGDCIRLAFSRFGSILAASITTGLIIGFGIVLFVVPGLMFLTWYFLTIPVLMVEKLGYQGAMARSKALTDGNRWPALGFYLVTTLVLMLVSGAVSGIVTTVGTTPLLGLVIQALVGAAVGTVGAVAPVVYYFNVRVEKEAFDIEALSSLVDAIGERGAAQR